MATETRNETTIISRISPKRILLVEDAPDVADTMSALLVKLGHRVELAADGKEGLNRYKAGKFDLVITDYLMPRMNGVELAETIKRRSPQQPILMVTAFTFTIAAHDGRPLPVDAVLRKPFHPREFNNTLTELFQLGEAAVSGRELVK
jgi:CheY-like chemotaxis protein